MKSHFNDSSKEFEATALGQLMAEVQKFGGIDKATATQFVNIVMPHILNAHHRASQELVRETEKAFGGCKKCYGKGYATFRHGESYHNGRVYATHNLRNDIKYCTCDRGNQLKALIANLGDTKSGQAE